VSPDTVSTDLESIIMTLLAKSPDERFSSAAAVGAALASQLEGPERVSLDVVAAAGSGASGSDVARAIPSSINSMHMIPLGGGEPSGTAPRQRSAEAQGLRDLLAENKDVGLEVAEPALESNNPAQASALDIDLEVAPVAELPAWAKRGGASARLSRVGPPAQRPRSGRGGLIVVSLVGIAATLAALAAAFLR